MVSGAFLHTNKEREAIQTKKGSVVHCQEVCYKEDTILYIFFMNPVGWFELPVNDMDRAMAFYKAVLEVASFERHDMGPLDMAFFPADMKAYGTGGSLVKGPSYVPSYDGTMVYFSTQDIEGTLERVTAQGGKVITAKMSIGEYGWVGHFEDSEGNRVALHTPPAM